MTAQTRTTLKTYFQTGDRPTQQQFADQIDSFLSLLDTGAQSIVSDVSALGNVDFRKNITVSGASTFTGLATFNGGASGSFGNLSVTALTVTGSGATSLSGNFSVAGASILGTSTVGATTAASLKFSSTSGIIGTTTNDSAAAGSVGEIISSTIAVGAAIALNTNTPTNITSITLTAGDWDVWFEGMFTGASTTVLSTIESSISAISATLDLTPGQYHGVGVAAVGSSTIFNTGITYVDSKSGPFRASFSGTATIFGVVKALFTTSTCSGFGILRARRIR